MIRPVLTMPNPELQRVCREAHPEADPIEAVFVDLEDTMRSCHEQGLGFAAPQIGVPIRLAIFAFEVQDGVAKESQGSILRLVNPRIVQRSSDTYFLRGGEGCFSVPKLTIRVERSKHVVVEAHTQAGEPITVSASDLEAAVFQHELDHFEGRTLYDRFSRQQRRLYAKRNGLGGKKKSRRSQR